MGHLAILDEDRNIISTKAVGKIRSDETKTGVGFPWLPDVLREVDEDAEGIDEQPSVIVLLEKCAADVQESTKQELKPLIEKINAAAKASDDGEPEFNVFFASKAGGLADRVRSECKLGEPKEGETQVVLMDIGDRGAYYSYEEKGVTVSNIEKLLDGFRNKSLTRKQMGGDDSDEE